MSTNFSFLQVYKEVNFINEQKLKEIVLLLAKENQEMFFKEFESYITKNKEFEGLYQRCKLLQTVSMEEKQIYVNKLRKEAENNLGTAKVLWSYFLNETDNEDQLKYWKKKLNITNEDFLLYFQNSDPKNDKKAKYLIGLCYYFEKDYEKCFPIFEELAMKGYAKALNMAGYCYDCGFGVTKDEEKAFRYYELSAEQGDPVGLNNVGYAYHNGEPYEINLKNIMKCQLNLEIPTDSTVYLLYFLLKKMNYL